MEIVGGGFKGMGNESMYTSDGCGFGMMCMKETISNNNLNSKNQSTIIEIYIVHVFR